MRLTVRVIGARNLRAMHFNGFSYPYVKLQVGKQRFKTKVAKMNLNPEWDQEFSFVVTHVREVLKLQVYDEDMLSIDDFLGQVKVPLEDLLPAENFSFATCWYQLLPNSKSDKAVDCGEICVAISLETAEATRSLTKTEASEEVQQAPTVFEAPLSQNNDICSEVTFDELLRSFESRHGGVGMPVNLQGILINQSYFMPPSDLNKFLFSPDSDFRQTLVQLQGCTDFKTEPWRIDKDGESLKRVISYTTAPSKLVRAVKATEEQSYLKANEKEYSVLLSASTPDLPCGTYFRTEVFFRIMPGPELDSEQQTSHLVISWRMNFLQSTLMKGMIENEARRSLEQNYSQFSDLLSEKIKPIDVDDAGSDKEQVLASLQGGKESDWNYIGEIDTTTMPAKQSNYKENTKVFTFEEVAKHNSKHDCWLLIGGKVYDVTKFLEDHPGGDDVLLSSTGTAAPSHVPWCVSAREQNSTFDTISAYKYFYIAAKDATNDFEDVGHSSTARAMMDEYYIGEIDATTIPATKKFIPPTQSNYKAYAIGEYYDGEYNDAESSLSSESISTLLSSLEMTDQVTELKALESVLLDENAEPAKLSYPFIRYITRNFSQEIGRGGFGVVYLGDLGTGKVAVKRLSIAQGFSDALFVDEIKCLIRTKHRNIVRFLGYCADTHGELVPFNRSYVLAEVPQRLLCFEYVPKGNLQKYLKDTSHKDEWPIRYQMIRGICYGLNYLHEQRIIHLDLKPDNILLDAHMNPKITDFGISRCFDEGVSRIYTVNVRGTKGSIAPETIDSGEITFKSDIYGLGNIIIHLLTGRKQFDFENWQTSLDMDGPQVRSCTEIAKSCVAFDQRKRPTIGEIVKKLNEIERL